MSDRLDLQVPPLRAAEFHQKFQNVLEPLTLFDEEDGIEEAKTAPEEPRPITPIESAIKKAPTSIQEVKCLIQERLQIREDIPSISSQDQQGLAKILMYELSAVWPDIRRQAPDPFLTPEDNKELERRVAVHVVRTLENLFFKYVEKAKEANSVGMFNPASNISRLKTQLAFEANKCLNVLNIRRKLAAALRHPVDVNDGYMEDPIVAEIKEKLLRPVREARGRLAKKLTLTRREAEELYRQAEMENLMEQMPNLPEFDRFLLQTPAIITKKKQSEHLQVESDVEITPELPYRPIERIFEYGIDRTPYKPQKSHSLPQVPTAEYLLEELNLTEKDLRLSRKRSINRLPVTDPYLLQRRGGQQINISPREDLEQLSYRIKETQKQREDVLGEDLPPLLQALPLHTRKHELSYRRYYTKSEVDEHTDFDDLHSIASTTSTLEARNVLILEEENKDDLSEELHPQPAVVSKRLNDKSVVRTSDVRVSNRINKATITLKKHLTIYNNFKGEIDESMVKWLDRNLLAGEEVREVYEEVVKTMSKDHLQFDRDAYVERCPLMLDPSPFYGSSLLQNTKVNKILNDALKKDLPPPWGELPSTEWRNTPHFGGLGRQEIIELGAKALKEMNCNESSPDGIMARRPTKSYAAWLSWWRSTINSEDYFKFLSTQDNDYLSRVFHLYDSEEEDEEDDNNKTIQEDPEDVARQKEKQAKLDELRTKKSEYIPGVWNANSILLGGLGKDPPIEDVTSCNSRISLHKDDTSQSSRMLSSIPESTGIATHKSIYSKLSPRQTDTSKAGLGSASVPMEFTTFQSIVPTPEFTLQDRLERIWKQLKMPDSHRLDMAIKYSSDDCSDKLAEAVDCWEIAVTLVVEREELIAQLEIFERSASDPNRFFEKGPRGSSLARIEEAKIRDKINKKLQNLQDPVRTAINDVKKHFKDTVTYQGRPYAKKMDLDRIEMLYWLQQERRQTLIEKEKSAVELKLKVAELPSISIESLL